MTPDFQVAIIGTGFAGLCMAIKLKEAGETRFTVLERAAAVGGTWRDNTYPGCACDIPSQLYSFSFAQTERWSRTYPTQPEISAYLQHCTEQAGLMPFIQLSSAMEEAAYDEAAGIWRIRIAGGRRITARVLVSGMGGLSRPALPKLPGIGSFQGPAFHSAEWDHNVSLGGKRIAVIGTGASAVQFVPKIAPGAAQLTLFQRTPPWVLPKRDHLVTEAEQSRMRRLPGYLRLLRTWIYWTHEMRALAFLHPRLMKKPQAIAQAYLERKIPDPVLRAKVQPNYTLGCKRALISNDYYPALVRPNVAVETRPIARITPRGVELADGSAYAADVLIFGTGFQATAMLGPVQILGRQSESLAERWQAGAEAYLGLMVAGFPNLFLLTGPNTGLGHNSIVFMIEAQVRYVLSALRLMDRTKAPLSVRPAVEAAFNDRVQRQMSRTVWASGCRSWYMDASGRNSTLWPDFTWKYWLRTRRVRAADFEAAIVRP